MTEEIEPASLDKVLKSVGRLVYLRQEERSHRNPHWAGCHGAVLDFDTLVSNAGCVAQAAAARVLETVR